MRHPAIWIAPGPHWRMFSLLENNALEARRSASFEAINFNFSSDKTNKIHTWVRMRQSHFVDSTFYFISNLFNSIYMGSGAGLTHSNSDMTFRTVFNSFNRILMSVFPMLILCVVSLGTPLTSSFFKLNVTLAQSMASAGISYEMFVNSFTETGNNKIQIWMHYLHFIGVEPMESEWFTCETSF